MGLIKKMTSAVRRLQRWGNLQEFIQEAVNEKLDRVGADLPTEDEI